MQAFVILRNAIFAESGYNFDLDRIAPEGIKRESNVALWICDREGKPLRTESMSGTKAQGDPPGQDDPLLVIRLFPYPDPPAALAALEGMTKNINAAQEGNVVAKTAFGKAWIDLILRGFKYSKVQGPLQHALARHLLGNYALGDTSGAAREIYADSPVERVPVRLLVSLFVNPAALAAAALGGH